MKKHNSLQKLLMFILFSLMSSVLSAQTNKGKSEFSVEIDPATFLFKGYGFHLRYKPASSNHYLFGLGTYAMDFPSILVDLNDKNEDLGWDVRLNQGIGLFGEYHFSKVHKKWFVGTQLAVQEYHIKKDSFDGESSFKTSLYMLYGGYTWHLFDSRFYVKTWAGFAYTEKISGSNSLGNAIYDVAPILLFSAVHLGYTF